MSNLAHILQNLGMSSRDSNFFAQALVYQQLSLAIVERELGDDCPGAARLLYSTAVSLEMLGRVDEARPYVARSLAASENVFGSDDPFTEMVRGNLEILDKEDEVGGEEQ
ncbi:MAG: tetratricopeptide repeat protein [Rubrobacteraceae bacterium]